MESMPDMIGTYKVLRRLGAGGMGEVFLAYDPQLDREVAIKRILPAPSIDDERRARFRREARLAAKLAPHPSIVQVFHLIEGDTDAIVMEYIPGTTLRESLRQGLKPLAEGEGLRIAIAIAEGLTYAHRQGVIHRDLKTENILLAPDRRVKIADFGIARPILENRIDDELTRDGPVIGTWRVMSPEQFRGEPVDACSDLFSFGVLLYELFTGDSPFLAKTALATMQRIVSEDPSDDPRPAIKVNPEMPLALSDLIGDLLEKKSMLRPRDAGEVSDRLKDLAEKHKETGDPTIPALVPSPSPPPPAPPGGSGPSPPPSPTDPAGGSITDGLRRRWLTVMVALGLLVGLALAVYLFLSREAVSERSGALSVAVLEPVLRGKAPAEEAQFLAFALRGALQSTLTSFEGVHVKGTSEVDGVRGTPVQVARAVAADEVLETTFVCQVGTCMVRVNRLWGTDGDVIWSGQINVPLAEPLTASRAMTVLLRQAYPKRPLRVGAREVDAKPEDFEEYLSVDRDFKERKPSATAEDLLRRLTAIHEGSPRFVDAYLLEATIEANRFTSETRDPDLLKRALSLLSKAQSLAPGDPEVLFTRAWTETEAGRLDEAEATLTAFEKQAPGDSRVLDLRVRLLERRGRPEVALAVYRKAVEEGKPSWARLYSFANMARRQGEIDTARQALQKLFDLSPGNESGQWLLANIELTNGDPARAADLYEKLTARAAHPGSLVNLGLAYMLLGNYDGAAQAMEKAVEAAPHNYFYLLNLAEARWLQGRRSEAERLFRQVLELAKADPSGEEWQRLTVRAQALAHLGKSEDAVEAAQEALRLAPRNGQAAFEAALVYTITGNRTLALVNAKRARKLGFDAPAWFRLPWFDPLRDNPDFQKLTSP